MTIDLENIRSLNPIEQVVGEKFALKKSGSRFIGVEHDSLVVTPGKGMYFWNSKLEYGDVFDFVGRYMLGYGPSSWDKRNPNQFMESVEWLARRAGITLERDTDVSKTRSWGERQLVRRLQDALLEEGGDAISYAKEERGFTSSIIALERIGYMPFKKEKLLEGLNLSDTWHNVIKNFPHEMLVYVHIKEGRLIYLSGRSIKDKKHYNPPREIIGQRQPYYNHLYTRSAENVVIVEGQADAITFAQWGIPAVALCGMHASDELLKELRAHPRLFVLLDNTDDARALGREIALALKGETYVPHLPENVKDANEYLRQGGTAQNVRVMLNKAQHWLDLEVYRVSKMEGLQRQDALQELFSHAVGLNNFALAKFKDSMDKIGVNGRLFNKLLKAAQSKKESAEESDIPEVLSDSIPILSPALGFRRDVALVTVSITERTKENKLNTQPYLVTSSRELRRLSDEQILTINGEEIAFKAIPEGSEFLKRWHYSHICRYLNGETVQPDAVFNQIHDLVRHYIDFRLEGDSIILTLWTIGTYFYTMFPAYPYLALTGPKASGKSTVLRVIQPLAFNMINTSDPSGPSMFRLIHHNSCTVGIDEAERYHNPKDPAMQQIRQLLNSGYKQGMPAVRVIGNELKTQTFDVYSPKILASIMGLEDILASRCIVIPMRRSTKMMPSFPPDFDGAPLRHQLYILALTYFKTVYFNYFERPELYKLHNRSGELWSPLIALAAFFEEQSGIDGLLDTVSNTAEWNDKIYEGKSLSEREEVVLQALELITRGVNEIIWVKASDLRERVQSMMEHPEEAINNAQWIGHIMKRLQLTDQSRRKNHVGGKQYAIDRQEVLDMMQRYDVPRIENHLKEQL